MRRRVVLKGLAAAALQPLDLTRLPLQINRPNAATRRVRPSDPLWPTSASWEQLKDDVGGNLVEGRLLSGTLSNIRNPFYIGDQSGGTQLSGWLDAWTPAPSAYVIAARHTSDVVAGVRFARANNLRLVVKGGGHSYQGTSNAADSLLIWTRAMKTVTLHDQFVAKGSEGRASPVRAVTVDAGAVWIDVYTAVTAQAGRYVQGGGCTTVGVAGLVQSGGFGNFSKRFGTAASSLLEAEIVTVDGLVRTVNAHADPDLFWALKGGGGGSWGAVTRLTLRTWDLPVFFGGTGGTIKARSNESFARLIARFIDIYSERLFNPSWGESVTIGDDNTLKLSMVSQGLDADQARQAWQPFFDWVNGSPQDYEIVSPLRAGAGLARHWWDVVGNNSMIPDTRDGASSTHGWWQGDQDQVGAFIHGYDSLWLPASLLQKGRRPRLAAGLFASSRHKPVALHFNKALAGAPPDVIAAARETATNPAVVDAFALAIVADGEAPAYPGFPRPALDVEAARRDARAIDRATAELRKVAPDGGSYVSEGNYFNASWQRAYWGSHYARLRAIKRKYDPDGLFFVHHGVGSEEWSADGFTRLTERA
jgi:FAD/FMN-containing dehydrogenase